MAIELPTGRKVRLIAEVLRDPYGVEQVDLELLDDPWRRMYRWVLSYLRLEEKVAPGDLQGDFFEDHGPNGVYHVEGFREVYEPQIRAALERAIDYPPAEESLADVPELEWLWPGWLPIGLPALLAAAPGVGKSYLALDLARRVIRGGTWPDGTPVDRAGPVIYVDAEYAQVLYKERLGVWQPGELRRLYFMLPDGGNFLLDLGRFEERDRLRDMAWEVRPTLIVVDSFGASTMKGENSKEEVQGLLAFFTQVAREFECGFLTLHHLRKAPVTQLSFVPLSLDSIRGSGHIIAMSRQIWGFQFVPTGPEVSDRDPRRFWTMKSNMGLAPDPMGVRFEPHPQNGRVARIVYGEAPVAYREPTRTEECADWLLSALMEAGEPVKPGDLVELGKSVGFYSSIIYRARQDLGDLVVDTKSRQHPGNAWALAEWEL